MADTRVISADGWRGAGMPAFDAGARLRNLAM